MDLKRGVGIKNFLEPPDVLFVHGGLQSETARPGSPYMGYAGLS